MNRESDHPLVCDLGSTGQRVRRALAAAPQPTPGFREDLRRQLVAGAWWSPAASVEGMAHERRPGQGLHEPRAH